MSRGQINQTFGTASNQNQDYTTNATTAFGKAQGDVNLGQGDVNTFQSQLAKFKAANPYVQGGEYAISQNQSLADTANAGAIATRQALESAAVHGGANPAPAIAGAEEVAQQNQRTLGSEEAKANQERITGEAGYNEKALGGYRTAGEMQNAVTGQQGTLASQQGQLGQDALKTALGAAEWHDPAADEWNKVAGNVTEMTASALLCPARGSLYLLANGAEMPVELLRAGDELMGIDGEAEKVEEIQTATSPVLRIETDEGHAIRVSRVHAFALPKGGFVVASHCLGKTILTGKLGQGRIRSVSPGGVDTVFNVITGGSHTYRANGLWSLGVGEAERVTSMNDWDKIADAMPVKTGVA